MATLTDEEKAKAVLGGDVEPEKEDEPTTEPGSPIQTEEEPEEVEVSDPEKPAEDELEPDSTFTKQFPNLKGETLQEYTPELEKAYDNSFKESLRLVEENKQLKAQLAQATQAIPAEAPTNPASQTTQLDPVTASLLEDVKAERSRAMISAFDEFKKDYPQALESANFEALQKASDGVQLALTATLGYKPSWEQLFKGVAGSLGWQPNNAARNATIKENAASSRTPGNQSPVPSRPSKVSDAQIDTYLKMFTSKTREEARKELSEVV